MAFDRTRVEQAHIDALVPRDDTQPRQSCTPCRDGPSRVLESSVSVIAPIRQSWYGLTCCMTKMPVSMTATAKGLKASVTHIAFTGALKSNTFSLLPR